MSESAKLQGPNAKGLVPETQDWTELFRVARGDVEGRILFRQAPGGRGVYQLEIILTPMNVEGYWQHAFPAILVVAQISGGWLMGVWNEGAGISPEVWWQEWD